jgi:hypothetical protein
MSFHSRAQQTIDKLNTNQLKLPKESVSKALLLDATGQVKSSSTVTDTELSYLDGLTDTLVNLLSGKANDADVVKLSTDQSINGIKTFTGKLVTSSTTNGSIPCPAMTQTQRDLLTASNGECVYNTTTLKLNIYDGSIWKDIAGASGVPLWVTSFGYSVNDVVIQSDRFYRCLVAHTSGTFATDLSSGKWTEVSAGLTPGVTKAVVYSAFIGAAGTVFSEIGNLIIGNCSVASTNVFTCSFTSGIFASDPVCQLTVMGISGASRSAYIVTSPTTTGLTYLTYNTSGPTAGALNVQLTCHGVSP